MRKKIRKYIKKEEKSVRFQGEKNEGVRKKWKKKK